MSLIHVGARYQSSTLPRHCDGWLKRRSGEAITKTNRTWARAPLSAGLCQMSKYRKSFLIWLAVMVPLVIGLTVVGMNCESCIIQEGSTSGFMLPPGIPEK